MTKKDGFASGQENEAETANSTHQTQLTNRKTTTPPRPNAITPDATSMPDELKSRRQWVAWQYEWRNKDWTKVPINPRTHRKADSTIPATWGTFHEAMEAFQQSPHGYCGVGFVFSKDDPYTGVDLDDCRDPSTGEVAPWAEEIIDSIDSYSEVSPSGTGVKMIVCGMKPGSRCRTGPIEIYGFDRYFALTGQVLPRRRTTIQDRQEQLEALYHATFGVDADDAPLPADQEALSQDDETVLTNAMGTNGSEQFAKLWIGDFEGYDSHSEADLALCGKLAFWTRGDKEQIDRLFRRSKLYRAKWDRPDYRRRTIKKAISKCKSFYNPDFYKSAAATKSGNDEGESTDVGESTSQPPSDGAATTSAQGDIEAETPKEFEPFPVDALPKPIRDFVEKGAKALGCDPSYLVLPVLAALAGAIGNSTRIRLKFSWTEPAIIWVVIIGDSGAMKTPAFKLVMKVVRRLQGLRLKEYEEANRNYVQVHLKYETDLAAWKAEATKAAKAGRGADFQSPPEEPLPPVRVRYFVSDPTVEAIAPILGENPRGLLLGRDELSGLIKSFNAYRSGKGGDREHWLSMHSGEAIYVDRKTDRSFIHVPMASVSIAGGTQPHILKRIMGFEERESGLLARVLMAMPPKRRKRWTEAELSEQIERGFSDIVERLYALEPDQDADGDPTPALVDLSPDAKAAWVEFFNEHADEQAKLIGELSAAWSKLEGYAARLALIIHLVRVAAGDPTIENPQLVDRASIVAGVTITRWFCRETSRIYAFLQQTPQQAARQKALDLVVKCGGAITVRDLQRQGHYATAKLAQDELDRLVALGRGQWVTEPQSDKGGAPSRRFVLSFRCDNTPAEEACDKCDSDRTPADDPGNGGIVTVTTVTTPINEGSVTPQIDSSTPQRERRFL